MRKEKDSLGEIELPDDAVYGVQTRRAMDNFRASGEDGTDGDGAGLRHRKEGRGHGEHGDGRP